MESKGKQYKVYPNHLYHQSYCLSAYYNLQYTNTNEKRSNVPRFTFRPTIDMAIPYKSQTPTTQLKNTKYYWLIGQTSQLSVENKLLLYKTTLKPTWTDGIELWGCSKPSNTKTLQAFQSKALRLITNAPRHVNNQTLHADLSIPYVDEVITTAARNSTDRNSNHHNPLIANLYNRPLGYRRLRRHWPEDLIEWTLQCLQWMEPYSGHMPA